MNLTSLRAHAETNYSIVSRAGALSRWNMNVYPDMERMAGFTTEQDIAVIRVINFCTWLDKYEFGTSTKCRHVDQDDDVL